MRICVGDRVRNALPGTPSNVTAVTLMNPDPRTVKRVPPEVAPNIGDTESTAGGAI
jgi:hypothetical protein